METNNGHQIIIMGVAACGKTTVGRALASHLSLPFFDADDYHPKANKIKMGQGRPLTDQDRQPWLNALKEVIETNSGGLVLACSALKQSYREQLHQSGSLSFVFLEVSESLAMTRAKSREHFMPPEQVADQFRQLEAPGPEEALVINADQTVEDITHDILNQLDRKV